MFYAILKIFLKSWIVLFNRMQVIGLENLPSTGPLILVSNHLSYSDPLVLGCACPLKITFVAKEELFRLPLINLLVKGLGAIPVKRGKSDRSMIEKCLEALQNKKTVGIFIEGTRNRKNPDIMLPPQPGPAMLAVKTGALVIPVALINSPGAFKSFGKVKVIFGPARHYGVTANEESPKEIYDQIGRELTREIINMRNQYR